MSERSSLPRAASLPTDMLATLLTCLCPQRPPSPLLGRRAAAAAPTQQQQPVPPSTRKQDGPLLAAPLGHDCTVAFVPPDSAWPPIQAVRYLVEDKGLWRWPPHANLLYPFVAPRRFREAAPILLEALSAVAPFTVTLNELRVFVHKRSATLWLHPDDASGGHRWQQLSSALQAAMPQCDAQTANHGGTFTAHVTVGHFESEEAATEARARILESGVWPADGVSFCVREVTIMAREGVEGQFEPRWKLPLGLDGAELAQAAAALEPISRDTRFAGMPLECPDFCRRQPKRKGGRRRSQRP